MRVKVLASGCFDCLHPGHVDLLRFAKEQGDQLIVAINGDDSVRRLKGEGRPIYTEAERLLMVEAVRFVDSAFIFREDDVVNVLQMVKPNVWVKGADRNLSSLHQGELQAARELGCRVLFCPLRRGYSTTGLVERLRQ